MGAAKPAQLPILQAAKFEFALNLMTAKRLASKSIRKFWPLPMKSSSRRTDVAKWQCVTSIAGPYGDA